MIVTRLIKLAISVLLRSIDYLEKVILLLVGIRPPGRCVVLYYHAITRGQRDRFARQMDNLLELATPISAEIPPFVAKGVHYAAVTFDDAFISIIENAIPELVQREITFTVFVPTGHLGRRPEWMRGREEVVMSEEQLKGLGHIPIASIGSHCVTHSDLLSLDAEEAKNEIIQSKRDLENIVKRSIRTISFPHGTFDQKHVELARQAGYERVFSILPRFAFSHPDEYVTGRVRVDATDWLLEFRLKLLGAYRWLPLAFFLKRKARLMISKCPGLNRQLSLTRGPLQNG
jgi:peptidoglycan/xylan/chitin deacetylase (PgdA/CDA1 family)